MESGCGCKVANEFKNNVLKTVIKTMPFNDLT